MFKKILKKFKYGCLDKQLVSRSKLAKITLETFLNQRSSL